jgi:hypothetical protein
MPHILVAQRVCRKRVMHRTTFGSLPPPGPKQENCRVLTRRGQVHVFGQYVTVISARVSRKMDQTPEFAVLLCRPQGGCLHRC